MTNISAYHFPHPKVRFTNSENLVALQSRNYCLLQYYLLFLIVYYVHVILAECLQALKLHSWLTGRKPMSIVLPFGAQRQNNFPWVTGIQYWIQNMNSSHCPPCQILVVFLYINVRFYGIGSKLTLMVVIVNFYKLAVSFASSLLWFLRHSLTIIQNHFIWILGHEVHPNSQVFLLLVPMAVVLKLAFFRGLLTLCLYPWQEYLQ